MMIQTVCHTPLFLSFRINHSNNIILWTKAPAGTLLWVPLHSKHANEIFPFGSLLPSSVCVCVCICCAYLCVRLIWFLSYFLCAHVESYVMPSFKRFGASSFIFNITAIWLGHSSTSHTHPPTTLEVTRSHTITDDTEIEMGKPTSSKNKTIRFTLRSPFFPVWERKKVLRTS